VRLGPLTFAPDKGGLVLLDGGLVPLGLLPSSLGRGLCSQDAYNRPLGGEGLLVTASYKLPKGALGTVSDHSGEGNV